MVHNVPQHLKPSLVRFFLVFILFVWCFGFIGSIKIPTAYAAPKLANLYFDWNLDDNEVKELAKWDVVVVDMENQLRNPEALRMLKKLNPRIIILAYISMQEVSFSEATKSGELRNKLKAGISDSWYIYGVNGQRYSPWPGNYLMNVTEKCPEVNGKKWNTYVANFVGTEILSSGLWDGVFYDNAWGGIDWYTRGKADFDRDGTADGSPDDLWKEGIKTILNQTKRNAPPNALVVINQGPGHREYRSESNGALLETFPASGWNNGMQIYDFQSAAGPQPKVMLINANTHNTGARTDYKAMRFGLGSALLKNGYFSFDYGDQAHNQTWWYDEYAVELGAPLTEAISVKGSSRYQETGVWKREYTNGIVLVNPSSQQQTVDLKGDFEKIIGSQDARVNNGAIVEVVTIPAKDGLLMLRTLESVKDTVYNNGSFLRFYRSRGEKGRNGFFAFESGVSSGAQVYRGDINGDGSEELVVASGGKLEVRKGSGQVLWSTYPYGAAFKGVMRLAVGTVTPSDNMRIAVVSTVGDRVVVYSSDGKKIKELSPLGNTFKGGYSVAIGDVDNDGNGDVILGVGKGKPAEVLIYTTKLDAIKKRFLPYGKTAVGGIEVMAGHIMSANFASLVTLSHSSPQVRVFSGQGKQLSEFKIPANFSPAKTLLSASDVTNNGVDEIILMEN